MALTEDDKDELQQLFQAVLDQYDAQLGKRLDDLVAFKVGEAVKPLLDPGNLDDDEPEPVTVTSQSRNGNGQVHQVPGYAPGVAAAAAPVAPPPAAGIGTWLASEQGESIVKLATELVGLFKPNQQGPQAVEQMVKASAPMMDVWNNGAQFAAQMYTYAARATGSVPDANKIDWTNPLNAFSVGAKTEGGSAVVSSPAPADISAEVKRLAQNNVTHAEPTRDSGDAKGS